MTLAHTVERRAWAHPTGSGRATCQVPLRSVKLCSACRHAKASKSSMPGLCSSHSSSTALRKANVEATRESFPGCQWMVSEGSWDVTCAHKRFGCCNGVLDKAPSRRRGLLPCGYMRGCGAGGTLGNVAAPHAHANMTDSLLKQLQRDAHVVHEIACSCTCTQRWYNQRTRNQSAHLPMP